MPTATASELDSSFLALASRNSVEEIVQLLLDHGAGSRANNTKYGGLPPLHAAAKHGQERIAQMLLDHGADPDFKDRPFGTALIAASIRDHENIVGLLLDRGADVNSTCNVDFYPFMGSKQISALQVASNAGSTEVVRLLLGRGADPHWHGDKGTALQLALREGHKDIAELLLAAVAVERPTAAQGVGDKSAA